MSFEARYLLEQELLPQLIIEDKHYRDGTTRKKINEDTLHSLLRQKGSFLISLMNNIGSSTGIECPYSESQFGVDYHTLFNKDKSINYRIVVIDMPTPESMPLCSRIFICYNSGLFEPAVYMVEKSFENDYLLCGSDGECHYNFGLIEDDRQTQYEKVRKEYRSTLTPHIKNSMRSAYVLFSEYHEEAKETISYFNCSDPNDVIMNLCPMMCAISDYVSYKTSGEIGIVHTLIGRTWAEEIEKDEDTRKELRDAFITTFEELSDYYFPFLFDKKADMEFWRGSEKPEINPETNPIFNCTAAFCDILYNIGCGKKTDDAHLLDYHYSEDKYCFTEFFSDLYSVMMDFYNDMYSQEEYIQGIENPVIKREN